MKLEKRIGLNIWIKNGCVNAVQDCLGITKAVIAQADKQCPFQTLSLFPGRQEPVNDCQKNNLL